MGDVRSFHGLLTAAALATSGAATADIVYVDDDAPPGGDGTSWPTAHRFLYDATTRAPRGSEVRIAQGTYRPDRSEEFPEGSGDPSAYFDTIEVAVLRGGYAGLGAEDPDARDVDGYATILSGDLAGDDAPDFQNMGDNSRLILRARRVVVDGLTITDATVDGARFYAVQVFDDVTIRDCTFTRNQGRGVLFEEESGQVITGCTFRANGVGGGSGGGILNYEAHPVIEDCLFVDNRGGSGAAISNIEANPHVRRCVFLRNRATRNGGAVYNEYVSYTDGDHPAGFVDCLFLGNSAGGWGGAGMVFHDGRQFVNCVFVGNRATEGGGALLTRDGLTVVNCSFRDNAGSTGGAIRVQANGRVIVENSILWRDEPDEITFRDGADVTVRYSIVRGDWPGSGNLDEPPDYVARPDSGPDGEWGTEDDDYGDLRLRATSPAIDAADNGAVPTGITQDLDGFRRFVDDPDTNDTGNGDAPIVDMGAYEFGAGQCRADLDGSGAVDFDDLLTLLGAWGEEGGIADLDRDGVVDFDDLVALLSAWGPC